MFEGLLNKNFLHIMARRFLWIGLVFAMTIFPREVTDTQSIRNTDELSVQKYKIVMKPAPHNHSSSVTCDIENQIYPLIASASLRHRVDPALVKAIIMAESGYDRTAVSERGAVGLMQLMPDTADAFGVKDSFDPVHNIDGGVKYLSHLIEQCEGDLLLAVAAYNAGIDKVRRHKSIPQSTKRFVRKVLAYYQAYREESPQRGNMI